jgi:ribosome-associated translation inhibitor RaiA
MKIYTFAKSREVPEALRVYTESRVWRALGRVSHRLPWVAVRLSHREDHAVDSTVVCQLDTWLRGTGIVTVTHTDVDTYVAIDRAAARLEQAVLRRIRAAPRGGNAPWNAGRRHRDEELFVDRHLCQAERSL